MLRAPKLRSRSKSQPCNDDISRFHSPPKPTANDDANLTTKLTMIWRGPSKHQPLSTLQTELALASMLFAQSKVPAYKAATSCHNMSLVCKQQGVTYVPWPVRSTHQKHALHPSVGNLKEQTPDKQFHPSVQMNPAQADVCKHPA